jgi:glycosyltransferase involved in cell wall biosynthesis
VVRVLFSALSARRGGGQTYIRNIAGEFPRGQGHKLTVLSSVPIEGLPEHPDIECEQAPRWTVRPITRRLFGALYFRHLWPRRHDFDIAYYAGGSVDVALPGGVKRVVAFRNMLPFDYEARRRFPLGWNRFRHWLLEHVQARAFRGADLVIFISSYARGVIDKRVPSRRGGSVVIPHGATATSAPLDPSIAALLPERYVLYLSILESYKAQVEAVEAWAALRAMRHTPEKLVLAGPESPRYGRQVRETIQRLRLENEVILTGSIRHDQVSDIARRAALNLFLSSCENCPNILLELMLTGTPLLVSDRQPMPELGGPGLEYVSPYNPPAIARAIARLLDSPEHAATVAEAARERSKLYTWERAGQLTWQSILRCAEESVVRTGRPTADRLETNV